jgi:hypothetical protein
LPASGTVTLVATATVATAVTGLTAPLGVIVKTATVRDLASELAVKNAELATVTAQLAAEKAGRANDSATAASVLAAAKAETAKANADAATAKISAQVAADLAKATYVAEYNALAKKWNAKFPKAKVALKK